MRIALFYYIHPSGYGETIQTVKDFISCFKKYSEHEYDYFNLYYDYPFSKIADVFDAFVFHFTLTALKWKKKLSFYTKKLAFLSGTKAFKMVFTQDEYINLKEVHDFINTLKMDAVFTLSKESEFNKFYPEDKVRVKYIINYLPGYIEESNLKPILKKKKKIRSMDLGYRARNNPFWLGEFSRVKADIAAEFLKFGSKARMDISTKSGDSFFGKKWFDFLTGCRCVLATEGGASVFDYEGNLKETVENYLVSHPQASFSEVQQLFFKDKENEIDYKVIGPKYFEAVMCGTCIVAYQGDQSGIFKKGLHYLEVKSDYSNVPDIIEKIKDPSVVNAITERAYTDIFLSGKYSYKTFIGSLDTLLRKEIPESRKTNLANRVFLKILLIYDNMIQLFYFIVFFKKKWLAGFVPEKYKQMIKKILYFNLLKIRNI